MPDERPVYCHLDLGHLNALAPQINEHFIILRATDGICIYAYFMYAYFIYII